jgi:predicted acyltransferase
MNSSTRITSIDAFRGFAILTMLLANYLAGVKSIPLWLKHAPDVGLTVIDLVAPFFIFAIGLTYGLSLRRRVERLGWAKAAGHTLTRYLALVGVGAVLSAGEKLVGMDGDKAAWGALQAIGISGLVALPFMRLPAHWRAILGLALLAGYQLLLDHFWLNSVLGASHGGLQGSLGWASMLILTTALADVFHAPAKNKSFPWLGLAVLAAGLALAVWVPVSKNRVSASYVLFSLGASTLLFWYFHLLCEHLGGRYPLLECWGRNPLALYFIHLLLLGLVALPPWPGWYALAPLWLVALQAVGLLALLTLIANFLNRRGWFLVL